MIILEVRRALPFLLCSQSTHLIIALLLALTRWGGEDLFHTTLCCGAGIRTHVGRVAPNLDLLRSYWATAPQHLALPWSLTRLPLSWPHQLSGSIISIFLAGHSEPLHYLDCRVESFDCYFGTLDFFLLENVEVAWLKSSYNNILRLGRICLP